MAADRLKMQVIAENHRQRELDRRAPTGLPYRRQVGRLLQEADGGASARSLGGVEVARL